MFKLKIFSLLFVFSFLLVGTSTIKNETREIERKINNINQKINLKEKDLNESQLDFFYLTSPGILEQRINHLDNINYVPMDFSKIFLDMSNFLNIQNQFAKQKNEKKK